MSSAPQAIFRIRRDYNGWVANETLEDYALRYTPRHFRKWSEFRVANTAFGATSFLALEAIGGVMALSYGFANALWAILAVGLVIFLTALPISIQAARHGLDMDLLTRGAGFGYLGSTLTSLVYASFTFIFFALEAAILALALQLLLGWPLAVCYLVASLGIVPLVMHGITLLSRLQLWTQPLWIVLLACPFVAVALQDPGRYAALGTLAGRISGSASFDWLLFGAASTVALPLVVQVGEQVDYLRFLPEKTSANRGRWWAAVLLAGPGWIVPGVLKMLGGAFLACLVLHQGLPAERAVEPTQMFLAGYGYVFDDPRWGLAATVLLVLVSQVKINVTNAYAGSLAWSNFFARLTHSHPGRVVWLVFNVLIAVLLMTLGVFEALESVLGLYGNVAIAWVGSLVADLVINKPLGWSPRHIEFRRAHLYDINPVGCGAMLVAAGLAVLAYCGAMGEPARSFAPFIALFASLAISPVLAWLTRGRYYLARHEPARWRPGEAVRCVVCENRFESEDMAHCPAYGAPICSLCCTLDSRCQDRCKRDARAVDQLRRCAERLLPRGLARRIDLRVAHYGVVALSAIGLLALIFGMVYQQHAALQGVAGAAALRVPFLQAFALLALATAVVVWWMVLSSESRRIAEEESSRQNQLLTREIEAHRRTDAALQQAKDAADAANLAKTRYVTGMTHELRTPLNGILGYAQILRRDESLQPAQRRSIDTIYRSGEHLLALIDGSLDLARIEAGRLRLDPAPLPLPAFLDDIARMVAPQAAAKGLAFELRTEGRIPPWVRADAKRLRQILLNLLGNAVRFTEQGRIRLLLDHRREVARFEVEDSGIGIAPQDLERIFLPFERGSAGRRSGDMGTGLGLTITHLLTQLMGGELGVRSTLGRGSVFTVRLYLSEIGAPAAGERAAHRPLVGYIGPRRRLLVVDDQPTQRQMLAGLLLPLGFDVAEAASGAECIESAQAQPPDAVLLDISMDDMDGWEAARRLRALGLRMPILMVSANAFENRPEPLQAAGCQAFIDKPVMESQLLDALQRHLELEWVSELAGPAWTPPPARLTLRWPAEAASVLLRLARLGHPAGLRAALQELLRAHPDHAADAEAMAPLVDACAWPVLVEALRDCALRAEHADAAAEAGR